MNKKVLVVSMSAWNSVIGSNTWSTLLENYNPNNIANISLRDDTPDSKAANNYFIISERRIFKSIFNRKIETGYKIDKTEESENNKKDIVFHNKIYNGRKKHIYLKRMIREIIWILGKWKSDELNKFVDEFNPDVVLYFMDGYIHFNRICRYVKKRANAKSIGFFVDDTFTYKQSSDLGYKFLRFFQRKSLHKLALETDSFWAITEMTKYEADNEFNINCKVISKPLRSISQYTEPIIHKPISILYTGNLQIGRDRTLVKLVQALKTIKNMNFVVDIYTKTKLNKDILDKLKCDFCKIHAAVEQDKIFEIQKNSDILLFLEDIDGKDALTARLSFSTKITDYLSCSKCILAIGNKNTTPMKYFKKYNAALVAETTEDITQRLKEIISNPSIINIMARNAYECGINNHSKENILKDVDDSINALF